MTAYLIASDTFETLVREQARARKVEPKLIIVKHPIGGLNAEELEERIDTAYEALRSIVAA